MRKGEQARDEILKDVNGQILRDGVEVRRRWAEYFKQVLNVTDVREANINVVGNWRMPVLGDLNERAISLEEVRQAVNDVVDFQLPYIYTLLVTRSNDSQELRFLRLLSKYPMLKQILTQVNKTEY